MRKIILFKIHLNPCKIWLNQTLKSLQNIKNSIKMEETIDGHLLSYIILLDILDGSHYQKSYK